MLGEWKYRPTPTRQAFNDLELARVNQWHKTPEKA